MTEQASVRWYDAKTDIEELYSALWGATTILRKTHRPTRFAINRPRLWRLIEDHGGLHARGTWLRIEQVLPGSDYIVIKQRQPDGTDTVLDSTPVETLEVVGWPF
jgi:hypothetical protein